MKIDRDFLLKVTIVCVIIIIPIIILFGYSKKHTFIEQNKTLSKIYSQYFTNNRYTVLYVGYTGCVNICTPRLEEIATIQRVFNDKGIEMEFMFLDLRELGDDVSNDFLKAFQGRFKLLSLDIESKKSFLRELGFYYSQSLYDKNEFEHTSYLYLIESKNNEIKLIATIMQYPFLNDTTIDFLEKKVQNEIQ